jgi:hypothetical protein
LRAEGPAQGEHGNAILLNGVWRTANREIGAPGLKTDFEANAPAGWRRHGGSGE